MCVPVSHLLPSAAEKHEFDAFHSHDKAGLFDTDLYHPVLSNITLVLLYDNVNHDSCLVQHKHDQSCLNKIPIYQD